MLESKSVSEDARKTYCAAADLSLIIPVFNTEEQFIKDCFLSVLDCEKLGLSLEVVVVDDGSAPDYARTLNRLIKDIIPSAFLVSKVNGGQNSARSLGLKHASGRYILFLDSDDRVDSFELSKTLSAALKFLPDILCFNFARVYEDGTLAECSLSWKGDYAPIDPKIAILESDSLWRQLYKRTFLQRSGISLVEGPRIGEDMASAVPLLLAANDIAAIGCCPYLYVQRSSSALHSVPESRIPDIIDASTQMLERISEESLSKYKCEIEGLCIEHVVYWGSVRAVAVCGATACYRILMVDWMNAHFPGWSNSTGADRARKRYGLGYMLLSSGHWRVYLTFDQVKRALLRAIRAMHSSGARG